MATELVTWKSAAIVAAALIAGGALYIRLRWHRSPQAYRAMLAVAACYFVAGSLVGSWALHFATSKPSIPAAEVATPSAGTASPAALPPLINPGAYVPPSGIGLPIPPLHFDPAHAALPDPKLTSGDVLPEATKDNVCMPGWAQEHRYVTKSERSRVYAEYGRTQGPGCCEVDHLIPLELGGSNDMKNLWPQPYDPRLSAGDKDALETALHSLVCADKMSLADAQKCIASDWVKCWEEYVVPMYGPAWASANRHGW